MDLRSLSRQGGPNAGTLVGVLVLIVAVLGARFLDWEWGWNPAQPVPLAIGVIAAVTGAAVIIHRMRG